MTENELHTPHLNFFSQPQPKKKTDSRLSRHFWIFLSGYLFINLISSQFQNYQIEKRHQKVVHYLELIALKESASRASNYYDGQMQLDNEKIKNLQNLPHQDEITQNQIKGLENDYFENKYELDRAMTTFSNTVDELNNFHAD